MCGHCWTPYLLQGRNFWLSESAGPGSAVIRTLRQYLNGCQLVRILGWSVIIFCPQPPPHTNNWFASVSTMWLATPHMFRCRCLWAERKKEQLPSTTTCTKGESERVNPLSPRTRPHVYFPAKIIIIKKSVFEKKPTTKITAYCRQPRERSRNHRSSLTTRVGCYE
jgi:hypothetical protein